MSETQLEIYDIDCPTLRGQVKEMIEELSSLCPSDAMINASFTKTLKGFGARVCVASESGLMGAELESHSFSQVIQGVRETLLTQIVAWRRGRFAGELPQNFS